MHTEKRNIEITPLQQLALNHRFIVIVGLYSIRCSLLRYIVLIQTDRMVRLKGKK